MNERRRLLWAGMVFVLASSIGLAAQQPPSKDDKKKTDAQNKEIQNIVKIVDDVSAGQPAPNVVHSDAPYCYQCGVQMQRAGSCHACPSCGSTSGCS